MVYDVCAIAIEVLSEEGLVCLIKFERAYCFYRCETLATAEEIVEWLKTYPLPDVPFKLAEQRARGVYGIYLEGVLIKM